MIMNDNNFSLYNASYRLGELISILTYYSSKHTISRIADILNIPKEIVRNDLYTLATSKEFKHYLFINGNPLTSDLTMPINSKDILCGYFDNSIFSITLGNNSTSEELFLQVSNDEFKKLQHNYLPEHSSTWSPLYTVKTTLTSSFNYEKMKPYLVIIEDAIRNKTPIKISLKEYGIHTLIPIALFYDVIDSSVYIVSIENNNLTFMALEKIFSLTKCNESLTYPVDAAKALDLLKYIWAPETISLSAEPQKVTIEIENQPNVIEKIRHDISHHKGEFTPQNNETFIYKTSVLGMESFISWILSYGSSITVLSPEPLRKEIYQTYLNMYRKYQA